MKIIAFGASYSKSSINRQFAGYTASLFTDAAVELLDLNDYPLPVFTVDLEKEIGHHPSAMDFVHKLGEADFLIISMSEHNGSYTSGFKNLLDWSSRYKLKMFEGKKILLLSTSPGGRGGLSSLETAAKRFPSHGAEIIEMFSLPAFGQNFSVEEGVTNPELKGRFQSIIDQVKERLKN
ncbi:NADPH-dependent FMN reductase [Pedobacter kyungheensis]|uniref:NADPH-dependent FMN reductase n=1 Tax=Pedobacter kyungheensis TaxID=1069985 RepID=A0A0C1FR07_9SPHI|nr:NAD(P)H-dependent oxidoreductase [Pedobacter kyungheensis]KIA95387.1 NADPH-dependent FMN reductase [Pedobacter kyungheensis]